MRMASTLMRVGRRPWLSGSCGEAGSVSPQGLPLVQRARGCPAFPPFRSRVRFHVRAPAHGLVGEPQLRAGKPPLATRSRLTPGITRRASDAAAAKLTMKDLLPRGRVHAVVRCRRRTSAIFPLKTSAHRSHIDETIMAANKEPMTEAAVDIGSGSLGHSFNSLKSEESPESHNLSSANTYSLAKV